MAHPAWFPQSVALARFLQHSHSSAYPHLTAQTITPPTILANTVWSVSLASEAGGKLIVHWSVWSVNWCSGVVCSFSVADAVNTAMLATHIYTGGISSLRGHAGRGCLYIVSADMEQVAICAAIAKSYAAFLRPSGVGTEHPPASSSTL